jgi:hypothetical protein
MSYNGWKNYETWNVATWMDNDEGFYEIAWRVARAHGSYEDFASIMLTDHGSERTPDGVEWDDPVLDHDALTYVLDELTGG